MTLSDRPSPPVDLLAFTPRERDVWDAGYLSGYLAGHDAGAEWADRQAAALHRRAVRIVHAMARYPEIDRDDAARRRARIDGTFERKAS